MLLTRLRKVLELLALVPLLAACSSLPPCPLPSALAYETPRGIVYMFDEENMGKMVQRLEGLKDGTCLGLPVPEELPEGARPS